MERSGLGWQRYLLDRAGIDLRFKENRYLCNQAQEAMAPHLSGRGLLPGSDPPGVHSLANDQDSQYRRPASQQEAEDCCFRIASVGSDVFSSTNNELIIARRDTRSNGVRRDMAMARY
jgi:hypothetical protein